MGSVSKDPFRRPSYSACDDELAGKLKTLRDRADGVQEDKGKVIEEPASPDQIVVEKHETQQPEGTVSPGSNPENKISGTNSPGRSHTLFRRFGMLCGHYCGFS